MLFCAHTCNPGVVWLYMHRLDLAVFNDERITLAARVAENRCTVKVEIKRFREFGMRIGQETDLSKSVPCRWSMWSADSLLRLCH